MVQRPDVQNKYFEALFVHSPIAILTLDSEHRVVSVNPAFEKLFGYSLDELRGQIIDGFIADDTMYSQAKSYTEAVQKGETIQEQAKRRMKNGSLVDVDIRGVPVVIDGEQVGALALYIDITDQLTIQRKLEQSQSRYKSLFDHSPIALWEEDWSEVKQMLAAIRDEGVEELSSYLVEHSGMLEELAHTVRAKHFNVSAIQLYDAVSDQELVERFDETFTDSSFRFFIDALCAFYRGETKWIAETQMTTLQGRKMSLSMLASIPPATNNSWSTVYLSSLDITEKRYLQEQLTETLHKMKILAMVDDLTGLFNRRAITEQIQEEFARSARERTKFGLAIVDVDGLKTLNDEYGHLAGDQAIKLVAEEIAGSIRTYDQVGRWGGDEFLLLLPGIDAKTAKIVADRVCRAISEKRLEIDQGYDLKISISMGIAIRDSAKEDLSLDELIVKADRALYQAKESGGNQPVVLH